VEDVKASAGAFKHWPVLESATTKHAFKILAGNVLSTFGSQIGNRVDRMSGR
jgi:hypothetical protein